MVLKSILPPNMSSDNDTIACMEATLQMAKDERARKAEWNMAKAQRIAEEKAAEACQVAEAKVVEECRIAEVQAKAQAQEEERRRAQAEAIKRQKAQAESEARHKAGEALGSGSASKGVPKIVGALEKDKRVERASCDHCTARGVMCEVSYFLLSFQFFL